MNAPFFKYGMFGDNIGLVMAFVIGIGFGFFLERAGFGNGKKLAMQFYFRDMAVLKVMFTAIVTAMLGVYYLSVFGMLDLSMVYLVPTNILPQVAGGLILGFGFVIGGYCPGTSCVSAATGKFDGMIYLLGVVVGIFVFGEMYPLVGNFYNATPMGQITVAEWANIPYGILVFAVVLMALGGFAASEWAEKINAGKEGSVITKRTEA